MAEEQFYLSDSVLVTNQRFVYRNTTYAIRQIVSLSLLSHKDSQTQSRIIAFGGILFLVAVIVQFLNTLGLVSSGFMSIALLVFGAVVALFAVIFLFPAKTIYTLFVDTSSGKATAMYSENHSSLAAVHQALTRALIHCN